MRLRNRAISFLVTTALVWNSAVTPLTFASGGSSLFEGLTRQELQALAAELGDGGAGKDGADDGQAVRGGDDVETTSEAGTATDADPAAEGKAGAEATSTPPADAGKKAEGAETAAAEPRGAAGTETGATAGDEGGADTDAPAAVTLEAAVPSSDGHTYAVRLSAGAEAGIPAGARLDAAEVVLAPTQEEIDRDPEAYRDRPRQSEAWVTDLELAARTDALSRALAIGPDGYTFWTKYLRLRVTDSDGAEVRPRTGITLEVETDAVAPECAASLEAALVDDEPAALSVSERSSRVDKVVDEDGGEHERAVSKITVTANRLGELALAGVVRPVGTWETRGGTAELLAPRFGVDVSVTEADAQAPEGEDLIPELAITVSAAPVGDAADPSSGRGTQLWLRTRQTEGTSGGITAWHDVAHGQPERLLAAGERGPVAVMAGERIDLLWDPSWSAQSIASGDVTLTGDLPDAAVAQVTDRTDDFDDPASIASGPKAADGEELRVVGAYDISLEAGGAPYEPDPSRPVEAQVSGDAVAASTPDALEVWRVDGEGKAESVPDSTKNGGVAFDASEPGTYVIVERVVVSRTVEASDGKTYTVTATFDPTVTGLPADAELRVRELADDERAAYERGAAEALGGGRIGYLRAFDVTIVDKDGRELEPSAPVEVSVALSDAGATDRAGVVHFAEGADGPAERVDATANAEGDSVTYDFEAKSFSVYAVGYTVDFHWGEYTYNLQGGDTIFLSELLPILIAGGEDVQKLQTILDDMSLVETVTFSDPSLVQVDEVEIMEGEAELVEDDENEELVGHSRQDWRLWSLAPFNTEEKLTIILKDGTGVEIKVTDIVYGDDAGETVTGAGGNRVTADGVTYSFGRDAYGNYAHVYAIAAGCTIHDQIVYNGMTYRVRDIFQTEGNLTKKPSNIDLGLIIRAAEDYSFTLPAIKTDITRDERAALEAEGYVAGANNDTSDNKVWKKSEYDPATNSITYTMKTFQSMKDDPKVDFIFIYDDSSSMYSGIRTTNNDDPSHRVRLRETQTTRVVILDAVNALLDPSKDLRYDIQVYLGGASTGHTTMEGPFTTYDEVAQSLSTYRTGVTRHDTGIANALAAARASKAAGREPVVVYLSDFHQAGTLTRNSRDVVALHNIAQVYGLSTDYRFGVGRAASDIPSGRDYMHRMNDIKGGVQELRNIILDAINYFMKDKVTVTDGLSDALRSNAVPAGGTDGGAAPAATGRSVWSLGGPSYTVDEDVYYPEWSGHIYTETFTVPLDPNAVYAGAMPTNSGVTVFKDGEKVNEVNPDALHLDKSLLFVLGELDERDQHVEDEDKTPVTKVNGIRFTLTEADGSGAPKAGATTHEYTTATVGGVDGVISVPYTEGEGDAARVVLELGKSYVLQEVESSVSEYNEGNAAGAHDLRAPDKSWLVRVAANGVITTEVNGAAGQTPQISVAPAGNGQPPRLVIWNQIVVPAILIPIKVQKTWPEDAAHKDPVPFTVYGVDRNNGKTYELTAYDAYNESTNTPGKRVKYIARGSTGFSEDGNVWKQTVYVPNFITTDSGDTITFFDEAVPLDSSILDSSTRKYKVGEDNSGKPIYLNAENWGTYDAADGATDGKIHYGQTYSYDITEGDMIYPDGWYTPSYGNNASGKDGHLNATSQVTMQGANHQARKEEWKAFPQNDTNTSNNFAFMLDISGMTYNGDNIASNGTNEQDKAKFKEMFGLGNDYTFKTRAYSTTAEAQVSSFFTKMKSLEVVVADKVDLMDTDGDGVKDSPTYYKFTIDPAPTTFSRTDWDEGNLVYCQLKLPKRWDNASNYPLTSTSNANYGVIRTDKLYVQEVYATFEYGGEEYSYGIYERGPGGNITHSAAIDNPCTYGPDGTDHKWRTAIYRYDHYFSSHLTNAGYCSVTTISSNALEKYEITPETWDYDNDVMSINACTLGITNTWNPNPLIPVTVNKNWVNADGGSVPSDVVALNDPVEFRIEGTTAKGGTKALPLFESDTWTTTDPDELAALTKGSITGDSSVSPWTKPVYVPTYDVLGTYDPETRTCQAYTFEDDSIIETSTLTAKIDGEERGEWEKWTSDYTAGETVYSATEKEWKEKDIHNSGNTAYLVLTLSPIGIFSKTIKSVRVRYYQQQDGSDRVQYTIINLDNESFITGDGTYYIPIPFSDDVDYASQHKYGNTSQELKWGYSEEYRYGIKDRTYFKVLDSESGEQTWTLTASKPQSGTQLGYESVYSIWFIPKIDHVTKPTFTLTNTFHPNVPVQLSSTFTDSTDDHASTGMIKSVVYTIEGTTDSGKQYSREVVTAGTPTANTAGESTTLSANTSTIYVPKGSYTITQTAYTLDGSTRYATTAYKTTCGNPATDGSSQNVTLSSTAATNSFSFSNTRKSLPITVQTHFDPGLTDEDIASVDTRPMQDRTLNYALSYTAGNGSEAKLPANSNDPSYANYVLNDSKFDTTSRNYTNTHSDGKVPTYSVFAELTECKIAPENITAALPDYMMSIISEEKDGSLVFTIEATVNRAPITVTKSWDEDIAAAERAGVTLNFSVRRSDGKVVYGTDRSNVALSMTTDEAGEAYNTFSLGTDEENTVIYLPAIRSTDVDANGDPVRYVLTETGATQGDESKTYYVNYADQTEREENRFEQTKPGKQSGEPDGENTNEARFVLTPKGISVDVNNANSPYICKIVETFGEGDQVARVEVPFRRLNKALTWARTYGNGKPMGADNPVKIEMLVDYVIPKTDLVTLNQATDNIVITTAATSDSPAFPGEQYFYEGDGTKATVARGTGDASSMFTVGSFASFTTRNIILDGGAVFDPTTHAYSSGEVNVNGGIVNVSGSLTVDEGTTMQNSAVKSGKDGKGGKGGAVYVSNQGTLTISGTASNGVSFNHCQAYGGGAIDCGTPDNNNSYNGNVAITYCSFEHCFAKGDVDGKTAGGAVRCLASTFTLNHCTFEDCTTVRQGGAVYHTGSTEFRAENSTFTSCTAGDSTRQAAAGAIETQAPSFTIDGCTFTSCTSNRNAGAINFYRNNNGAINGTISNSAFINCKADTNSNNESSNNSGYGFGGAMRSFGSGTINLENCTFDGCQATWGGAVACFGSVEIKGTTSIKNCTAKKGGGVYLLKLNSAPTLTLTSGTIQNCTASLYGGGVYQTAGTLNMNGGSIIGNTASSDGGGVYLGGNDSTFNLNGGIIGDEDEDDGNGGTIEKSNSAVNGGGIYQAGGTQNIKSNIKCNTASANGGGVYLGGGTLTFTSGTVSANTAVNGGGIYQHGGTLTIESGANVKANKAEADSSGNGGGGGGIYLDGNNSALTLTGSVGGTATTDGNTAVNGGGIYQQGGTLTMNSTASVVGNEANGGDGGGTYLGGGTMTINSGADVQGNKAAADSDGKGGDGGGVYLGGTGSKLYIHGNIGGTSGVNGRESVEGNSAVNGGGIYQASGTLEIDGGTIKYNKAEAGSVGDSRDGGKGGGIYLGGGDFTLKSGEVGGINDNDDSVGGNTAKCGGGLFVGDGKSSADADLTKAHIKGGKLAGNYATEKAGGGGIAIGGPNVRLYFEGDIQVWGNTMPMYNNQNQCDVCLSEDSNEIIRTTSAGLEEDSHIGVYVTDDVVHSGAHAGKELHKDLHGTTGLPFGTFDSNGKGDNFLNRFINNRTGTAYHGYEYYYGVRKAESEDIEADELYGYGRHRIYWADYVCEITDAEGNLLFTNAKATAPALYQYLDQYGAFEALRGHTTFYNANKTEYTGTEYYVRMLVFDYALHFNESVLVPANGKIITLTMAPEADENLPADMKGPAYRDHNGCTTIGRGACIDSVFKTAEGSDFTLTNVTVDGGGCTVDPVTHAATWGTPQNVDGGLIDAQGTLTLGANAVLQNSYLAAKKMGGAISFTGNGTLNMSAVATSTDSTTGLTTTGPIIRYCKATNGGALVVKRGNVTINFNGGRIENCVSTNGGVLYVTSSNGTAGTASVNGTLTTKTDAGDNVCIVSNYTATNGGAAYVTGSTSTLNLNGTIVGFSAQNGGGVYVNRGTLNMVPTVEYPNITPGIRNCQAAKGGAIFENETEAKVYFSAGEISDNTATNEGGGVYVNRGTLNMVPTVEYPNTTPSIRNCTAGTSKGGGVFVNNGTLNMTATDETPNFIPSIRNCTAGLGGAISENGASANVKLSAGEIYGNTATGNGGGALRMEGGSQAEISGTVEIKENKAEGNSDKWGGAVNMKSGTLTISGGTISGNTVKSTNRKVAYGGAVSVGQDCTLNLAGGTIIGNTAISTNDGSANTGDSRGPGIYLAYTPEGKDKDGNVTPAKTATLNISSAPVFHVDGQNDNTVTLSNYSSKKNGNESVYTDNKVRQDIYLAESGEEPASITLTGDLVDKAGTYIGDGTIWVWAEHENHNKQLTPFAKPADDVAFVTVESGQTAPDGKFDAAHLKAFRNAQDDGVTENPFADSETLWLYGTIEGDGGLIYWNGVAGSRKVILRKVDSTYASLSGKSFKIYKGTSTSPYIVKNGDTKTQLGGDTAPDGVILDPMRSLDSGVFWIGELPYGWYIIEEDDPLTYFYLVVTANGVFEGPSTAGGTTQAEAQTAAQALYNEKKDTKS